MQSVSSLDSSEELPPNWVKRISKTRNRVFYFNIKTKASVWTLPQVEDISINDNSKCLKSPSPKKSSHHIHTTRGISEISKTISRKNGAAERFARLQTGLKNELLLEKINTGPNILNRSNLYEAKGKLAQLIHKRPEETPPRAKLPCIPLPEINFDPELFQPKTPKTPANNRLTLFRDSISKNQDVGKRVVNMEEPESMDWEDIPEQEIIDEVKKIRCSFNVSSQLTSSFVENAESSQELFANSSVDLIGGPPLVIVVDTNVFLHNLPFISEIQGRNFKNLGKAIIFIPYIVLHELDSFKNSHLSVRARRCINYINEQFKSKNPFIKGQSAVEDEVKNFITAKVADDRILNACFQIKEFTHKVILLSNDNNLRNKAMFNQIEAYSQETLMEFNFNDRDQIKFLN